MSLASTGMCSCFHLYKKLKTALIGVDQLVGPHPTKQKDGRFDSQSGHMPELGVRSQVTVQMKATDQCFSPFLSPSPPLTLKINK